MTRRTTHRAPVALLALVAMTAAACARADTIQVAVAANFAEPAKRIALQFEHDTGHTVKLSFGATGAFYAQIGAGAPFDVLLAADEDTPRKIVEDGKGLPGTRKTYAIGRLVLWSSDPALVDASGAVLKSGSFRHLAIADPRLAPYGRAAQETLEHLGLAQALKDRLVTAGNIAQAWQFVSTGNAELGFVALSQVQRPEGSPVPGSMWLVPESLHAPLRQDVVVLSTTTVRGAAVAFARALEGDKARAVIKSYGYAW